MKLSDMCRNLKKFFKMVCKEHPWIPFCLILGGSARAAGPFLGLYYSAWILDSLMQWNVDQARGEILILLLGTFLLGFVDRSCQQAINAQAFNSTFSVWKDTAWKSYVISFEKFERTETLDKIRRVRSGLNGSGGVHSQIWECYPLVSSAVSVVCSLIFAVQLLVKCYETPHFLLYTLLLIILFLGLFKALAMIQKRIAEKSLEMNHKNERGNAMANYLIMQSINIQNGKDFRIYSMAELMGGWYEKLIMKCRECFEDFARWSGLGNGLVALLTHAFSGCVYLYVGAGVFAGAISIGNVLLYAGSITRLTSQINEAVSLYNRLAYRFEYLNLQEEYINSSDMDYDGTLPIEKRDDSDYEFEFRNVSFRYPDTDQDVLKNINLKFNVGSRMAIVGQNGAGKSTLIKLLCRLYEPTEGEILLNGINIKLYDYKEYTRIFSVIFQDFKLLPLPLDQNVACSENVDEEKCQKALDSVGLTETVMSWPKKQYTRLYQDLGEGINVSGGEAQKIAIARALYKDAPFVIMDEPTAALDPLAEAEIYEHFDQLIREKTAIFISHRLSSCKFSDEILVLDEGKILQRGTHEALVNTEGLYREMWNAQAQYYA